MADSSQSGIPKIDMGEEDYADGQLVKAARFGTPPFNLNKTDEKIVITSKDEGFHNSGISKVEMLSGYVN